MVLPFVPDELYHRFVWPTMERRISTHIHQLVMYITMIFSSNSDSYTKKDTKSSVPLDPPVNIAITN